MYSWCTMVVSCVLTTAVLVAHRHEYSRHLGFSPESDRWRQAEPLPKPGAAGPRSRQSREQRKVQAPSIRIQSKYADTRRAVSPTLARSRMRSGGGGASHRHSAELGVVNVRQLLSPPSGVVGGREGGGGGDDVAGGGAEPWNTAEPPPPMVVAGGGSGGGGVGGGDGADVAVVEGGVAEEEGVDPRRSAPQRSDSFFAGVGAAGSLDVPL